MVIIDYIIFLDLGNKTIQFADWFYNSVADVYFLNAQSWFQCLGVSSWKAPVVTGPEELFYVCRVSTEDQDIDIFEIPTTKIPGNEKEWVAFWAKTLKTIV